MLLSESIEDVFVATCDDDIASVIHSYGGKVIKTSSLHTNGTSRVAEAVKDIDCTHVILVQGDEPLLLPKHIDLLVEQILIDPQNDSWNVTGPIESQEELDKHSFVKCSVSEKNRILYCFRRTPGYSEFKQQKKYIRKILGLIAFKKDFLRDLTKLPASRIESNEFIEQMRIIENGFLLKSVAVSISLPSVNEPGEADIVSNYINKDKNQHKLLEQVFSFNK